MSCEYGNLVITPIRLDFVVKEHSPVPPTKQSLKINKVGGPLSPRWNIVLEHDHGAWIRATPMSGKGSKKVWISVDHQGFGRGEFGAVLTVKPVEEGVLGMSIPISLRVEGEPPPPVFKCPICGEEFGNQAELEWHISQKHPEPEPPEPPSPEPEPKPNPFERFFIWIWEIIRKVFNIE